MAASSRIVEIAVVTRTYQGLEGNRVKAGTRLAVDKAQGDLKVITRGRYQQLLQNRLVRPLGADDAKALPGPRYGAEGPLELTGEGTSVLVAQKVRQRARARARQADDPPPPKALAPLGSRTGVAKSVSSSPADPASSSSTSTSRGTRTGGATKR